MRCWRADGKTPEATIYAPFLREIQEKGEIAGFCTAAGGEFELGKWRYPVSPAPAKPAPRSLGVGGSVGASSSAPAKEKARCTETSGLRATGLDHSTPGGRAVRLHPSTPHSASTTQREHLALAMYLASSRACLRHSSPDGPQRLIDSYYLSCLLKVVQYVFVLLHPQVNR